MKKYSALGRDRFKKCNLVSFLQPWRTCTKSWAQLERKEEKKRTRKTGFGGGIFSKREQISHLNFPTKNSEKKKVSVLKKWGEGRETERTDGVFC